MTNPAIMMSENPPPSGGGGGGGGGPAPLNVSLSTTVADGVSQTSTVTSNSVTGTPSGGTAPYNYLWTVTGDASIVALNPNSATTAFRATGVHDFDSVFGSAVLKVTDNVGAIKNSATVSIELSRNSGGIEP